MTTLAVAEIFRSWQGEGPSVGRRAHFLRLGGCNLSCSWCDTPYTWDGSRFDLRAEITRMSVCQLRVILGGDGDLLVITGGEPLLQAAGIAALLDELPGREVEVETNGTQPPPLWAAGVAFNVSPKFDVPMHPGWYEVPSARFKFVVDGPDDLDVVADYGTPAPATWVMPLGTEGEQILKTARWLAPQILDRGWNLTLRQHVLLWGDERGR